MATANKAVTWEVITPSRAIYQAIIDRGGKFAVERDPCHASEDRREEGIAYQRYMKRKRKERGVAW